MKRIVGLLCVMVTVCYVAAHTETRSSDVLSAVEKPVRPTVNRVLKPIARRRPPKRKPTPRRKPARKPAPKRAKKKKKVTTLTRKLPKGCTAYTGLALFTSQMSYAYEQSSASLARGFLVKSGNKIRFKDMTGISLASKPLIFRSQGSLLLGTAVTSKFLAAGMTVVVGSGKTKKEFAILAFKGSSSKQNWYDNLGKVGLKAIRGCPGCKGHKGFMDGLATNAVPLKKWVQQQHKKGRRVIFAGHSLGGALAVLAVQRWALNGDCLITFGQPRAGNTALGRRVCQRLGGGGGCPRYIRVHNNNDPVPKVPPSRVGRKPTGFNHFGRSIRGTQCWAGDITTTASSSGAVAGAGRCHSLKMYWQSIFKKKSIFNEIKKSFPGSVRGLNAMSGT